MRLAAQPAAGAAALELDPELPEFDPPLAPVEPLVRPLTFPAIAPRLRPDYRVLALGTVAVATVVRLYLATVPLGNGEAYYYSWSHFLDWSYYDHPPLVAWLVWLTTRLGNTPMLVRLGPVLGSAAFGLLFYRLAERFVTPRAAYFGLLILSAGPVFVFSSFVVNPEATLVPLWVAYLLAVEGMRENDDAWRPLVAGLLLGLAFLSKYTGLLLVPATFLYFALSPTGRRWLRRPAFYGAGAVAMVLALPVLIWNGTRGWPSLTLHLVERGHAAMPVPGENRFNSLVTTVSATGVSLQDSLSRVFVGQFFSYSPFLAPLLALGLIGLVWRARRRDDDLFLAVFGWAALTPLLFAQLAIKDSEPHWTMIAMVPAAIAAGRLIDGPTAWARFGRGLFWAGMVASSLVLVLATVHAHSTVLLELIPSASYNPRADVINELLGWDELRPALREEAEKEALRSGGEVVLASNHYSLCGRLFYELGDQPQVFCLTTRRSQFDFIGRRHPPASAAVLAFTTDIHEQLPDDLANRACRLARTVDFDRAGLQMARYFLYLCPAVPREGGVE